MKLEELAILGTLAMAVAATGIGVLAMLRPEKMSAKYGIAARQPQASFVAGLGIRDVFVGFVLFGAWWREDTLAILVLSFLLSSVALVDFYIVSKHGDKKTSLVHLLGAVFCLGYGLLLFFLFPSLRLQ